MKKYIYKRLGSTSKLSVPDTIQHKIKELCILLDKQHSPFETLEALIYILKVNQIREKDSRIINNGGSLNISYPSRKEAINLIKKYEDKIDPPFDIEKVATSLNLNYSPKRYWGFQPESFTDNELISIALYIELELFINENLES